MHKLYFPRCPVDGPIEPPVPYNHMGIGGAIPNKCGSCDFLFEGGCTRFFDELQRYTHLDYGPCGVDEVIGGPIYNEDLRITHFSNRDLSNLIVTEVISYLPLDLSVSHSTGNSVNQAQAREIAFENSVMLFGIIS